MKRIRASAEALSSEELQAIHRSSLRILERVGVRVPHEECVALCARAGAHVEHASGNVRIPEGLMTEILERFRSLSPPDDEKITHVTGVISTQMQVMDYLTRTRRPGLLDDVRKGIALVQHLEHFPTANAVVTPTDTSADLTDVVSFQLIYAYSKKLGGTYVLTPRSAQHVIAMAAAMKRSVWFLLDPVSPLQYRKENIDIALIFAKAGQPLYIGSMVMAGATGPVTLAGTVTLHNAELLATLFLVHAMTQDYRYDIYNSGPHSVDPRTMMCSFGSPNQALLGICMAQLGRFYGIKRVANVGLTDALIPDFQCGMEKAATAIFSALAGIQSIGCQGLVGADQGFSFEQLVLDNEWMGFCNYILDGVEVTEETIAEELIETIGIGGNFLGEEHTARHFRKSFLSSKLLNRGSWENWIASGAKDTLTRAHEQVEKLTAKYQEAEPVCSPAEFEELNRIVEAAKAEASIPN